MTNTAFDIHRVLVEEEGYDPKSDEYYEEVDKRIRGVPLEDYAKQLKITEGV